MNQKNSACSLSKKEEVEHAHIEIVTMDASETDDYQSAMKQANDIAENKLGEYMLLSWYDKDRDFEAPQHASECHLDSAVPGYVDYAIYHGACLKIDFDKGRFVFFYL